jgi:hypothetical protein
MLIPVVRFPIATGQLAAHFRTELASWDDLAIAPKRPETMPRRFLSVRDDSGPETGVMKVNRFGVNIWADSDVDASNIARDAMAATKRLPGVWRFKSTSQHFGPIEIDDDPRVIFNGALMSHYYFSFAAAIKGVDAS